MKQHLTVSVERLRDRISYCAETGGLTWKLRVPSEGEVPRLVASWNGRYAGTPALSCRDNVGYRRGSFEGTMLLAHRVAWAIHHGRWPTDLIDHIDGDPSNNRIDNLREVDAAGNSQNMKVRRSSVTGVTGVSKHSLCNKFAATINVRGRLHYLGLHATIDDAARARKAAEQRYGFHPNHGRAA